jgi:hypothetical protein
MMIFAFMSASKVVFNSDKDDDYTEEHGWIDPTWSMTELFESRNDVRSVLMLSKDAEDFDELVKDVINGYDSNGDGTFYDSDCENVNGECWQYAIHFIEKAYGPKGWYEKPYIPKI